MGYATCQKGERITSLLWQVLLLANALTLQSQGDWLLGVGTHPWSNGIKLQHLDYEPKRHAAVDARWMNGSILNLYATSSVDSHYAGQCEKSCKDADRESLLAAGSNGRACLEGC